MSILESAQGGIVDILHPAEGSYLPASPEERIGKYLFEDYADQSGSWKRKMYYMMKPLLPRPIQIALRRRYVQKQAQATFPAWPIEPVVVDAVESFTRRQLSTNHEFHRLGFWPQEHRFAFVITHDVEWDYGLRRARDLVAIEQALGFCSSWNLVPERYPIDMNIVKQLTEAGNEIGIHGLKHDGKLFQSRRIFDSRMTRINEYAARWNAVGFRSPSTLRNAEWMSTMRFAYDSSYPDTDPYEPQPGGCCTIWPYLLGNMVELPLTMPQDHTLFEILKVTDISIWQRKAEWIAAHGGIVVINIHPDYMLSDERLKLYEDLLRFMKTLPGMWHVLPRDAAAWWRDRQNTRLKLTSGGPVLEGPAADRATILRTVLQDGKSVTAAVETK